MHPRVMTLIAVGALLITAPAHAEPAEVTSGDRHAYGWTDGQGVGALASEAPGRRAAGRGRARIRRPVCTAWALPAEMSGVIDELAEVWDGLPRGAEPGHWAVQTCQAGDGDSLSRVRWFSDPSASRPAALARQALNYAPLALPVIRMSPDPRFDQLVNVQTWLWVDAAAWVPMNTSASIDGVTVTTTAIPQRVRWDMGDGEQVVCAGPGTPYDPAHPDATPACSYAFRRPAEHNVVTATIEWAVRWAAPASRAGGGDLGTVSRSSSVAVRVVESQVLNIAPSERSSR